MRGEDRRSLCHKVNATENNDLTVDGGSSAGELQRVPDNICNVLYLSGLVIMGKDNCMPILFYPQNLFSELRLILHRRFPPGIILEF